MRASALVIGLISGFGCILVAGVLAGLVEFISILDSSLLQGLRYLPYGVLLTGLVAILGAGLSMGRPNLGSVFLTISAIGVVLLVPKSIAIVLVPLLFIAAFLAWMGGERQSPTFRGR